jgi:hypothetical protein
MRFEATGNELRLSCSEIRVLIFVHVMLFIMLREEHGLGMTAENMVLCRMSTLRAEEVTSE